VTRSSFIIHRSSLVLLCAASLAAGMPASAQQYPTRAVRVIVASSPGSGVDIVSRIVAQKLAAGLGQQVIVDNRAGAGANLGAEIAAKAPADGYTLFMGTPAHAINVSMYSGLNYDIVRDFAPVSLVSTGQYVVIVHPSVPARTVKALIALARSKPGDLAYGSAGPGNSTHLAGELFNSMAGTKMLHVPYKGSGPALIELMSGQLQVMFANITAGLPHMRTHRVRALAVTGPKRSSQAPELPTVAEAALPGYAVTSFFGVLVPAGTPGAIIAKLNTEIIKAVRAADVQATLATEGAEAVGSSPEEFAAYIRAEIPRWTAAVKTAGLYAQAK
jgi:tripartite-type tricarboxylate transporter receptor subunit TctC